MVSTGPVPGLEHTMPPLPTVLMSARAWREVPGSGREGLLLQLSMEAERAGDFRLSVRREPTKSPGNTVIAAFKLKDIFYDLKSSRCHELSTPGDAGAPMNFNFEDEREAQKWWTVVSSSLREARKASQGKDNDLRVKPALPEKPMTTANKPLTQAFKSLSLDDELPGEPKELATKEELALRLSRSIESGDEQMAVQCALMLTKQKIPLKIQLKQTTYPKKQILMKICVEDASGSVNISTSVQAHTTIATLKQQISREFLFHPNIQRWIIGQCLCSDDRTIASYGIRQDGDTAFLYLISAKQGRLHPQDHCVSNNAQPVSKPLVSLEEKQTQSKTLPTRTHANSASTNLRPGNDELLRDLPRILNSESSKTPGHVPAPLLSPAMADGWACSVCTYINKPTRPGCEMCSSDRPTDYVVPEKYKPDEIERKRLQQENDSLIQYKQGKGGREDHDQVPNSLEEFVHLSAEFCSEP